MNETQQFNLYRRLTIQALKALMEYLIRMTYPNKIGVLNSFPTVEKLNAHFILDPN